MKFVNIIHLYCTNIGVQSHRHYSWSSFPDKIIENKIEFRITPSFFNTSISHFFSKSWPLFCKLELDKTFKNQQTVIHCCIMTGIVDHHRISKTAKTTKTTQYNINNTFLVCKQKIEIKST